MNHIFGMIYIFREYTPVELKNIWVGNWDYEIENQVIVQLLFCITIFVSNFRRKYISIKTFIIVESLILILLSSLLLNKLNLIKFNVYLYHINFFKKFYI